MIRKSVQELKFATSRTALPSVEVQMESLEEQDLHLESIAAQTLRKFAAENPQITATIYSYGSSSLNFDNQLGYSEFLAVAGEKAVLNALGGAFKSLAGVKCRYSDFISPSDCIASYHIEDGCLWEPEDSLTWYSETQENLEQANDSENSKKVERILEEAIQGLGGLFGEEPDKKIDAEQSLASSTKRIGRAARADASVGTIRRTIEEYFGLPEGSVALCGPDGRALRGDALIKTLRRRWED